MRLQKMRRLIPAAAVMLFIFIHSAMPADLSSAESGWFVDLIARSLFITSHSGTLTFLVRKAAHFAEYLLLGICLRRGIDRSGYAWMAGTAYAVTDELHQYFVPGRSCELRDICIDAAGTMAGVLLMAAFRRAADKKGHCSAPETG